MKSAEEGKNFKLSKMSERRLSEVHPDLQAVVRRALELSPVDFAVLEGKRSLARQKQLVQAGASITMHSRHLTGHAVDLGAYVGGRVRWDWPLYHQIAPAVKQAALELGVEIEWGGDWTSFQDGPHWQLSWDSYPE